LGRWVSFEGFCAIVHYYHPELIDFNSLSPYSPLYNNDLAFQAAASLGVPKLLEAEDILIGTTSVFNIKKDIG